MFNELWQQIGKSAIIVTPTSRLARYLQQTYHAQHPNLDITELPIISLHEWLEQLWLIYAQQTSEPRRQLSNWQSTIVWQELVQQSNLSLLRPTALLKDLQQGWQYLQQWQVPFAELQRFAMEDTFNDHALFAKWVNEYAAYCEQHKWVDEFQLPNFLQAELKSTKELQQQWILYGFDYLVPQLQSLCQSLIKLGATISEYTLPNLPEAQISFQAYADVNNELNAAADWALAQMEKHKKLGTECSIAVVIPDLKNRWLQVQRAFTEILMPENLFSGEVKSAPFNLAGGLSLAEYPLITDTLLLIKSLAASQPYSEISHLLRSPYWDGQEEYTKRASLALTIAEEGYEEIDLYKLNRFFQTQTSCSKLLEILAILEEEKSNIQAILMPSEWAKVLLTLLEKINWPNGRKLTSGEYQAWERWKELLQELSSLDAVIKTPFRLSHILSVLQQQTRNIVFQPETGKVPIQIMSIPETAAIQFDHVWICKMTADNWPMQAKPNPFIPMSIQRHYQMPHATYTQELAFAQRFTDQWRYTSKEVIFSYPMQEGDISYLPSAMIEHNVTYKTEHYSAKWQTWFSPAQLEEIDDNYGVPLTLTDKTLRGGTNLLQSQAECPFQAYTLYRLGLIDEDMEAPLSLGSAMVRGNLVHTILYGLWKKIGSHERLQQLSEPELLELIHKQTESALSKHYTIEQKNREIPEIFIEVEHERLAVLIIRWLEKEKQRATFSVHALEKSVTVDLAGLKLNLRIDRIDQLQNNEYLIIDYKTKRQQNLSFAYERLVRPQLPLYALTEHLPLAGTVFAQVTADNLGFTGLVEEAYISDLPKNSTKSLAVTLFAQQRSEWRSQLETLAEEFLSGKAEIDPYPGNQPCQRCDLSLLCRVRHKKMEANDDN